MFLVTKRQRNAGLDGSRILLVLVVVVVVVCCATTIVDSSSSKNHDWTRISFVRSSTQSFSPSVSLFVKTHHYHPPKPQQPQQVKCLKNAVDNSCWNENTVPLLVSPRRLQRSKRSSTLLFQSWTANNNNNNDGNNGNYIDAEVVATSTTMKPKKKKTVSKKKKDSPTKEFELLNLIELAKKLQPDISTERVPFISNDSSSIDGILLYQIDIPKSKLFQDSDDDDDNEDDIVSSGSSTVTYTIATPADHAVALCYHLHNSDNDDSDNDFDDNIKYQWLDPDKDSVVKTKLFKVAGETLKEWFGQNLVLRNTPQTLTVMGDLDHVCNLMRQGQLPSDYLSKTTGDGDDEQEQEQLSDETKQQLRDMMKELELQETTEDEDDEFVRQLEEKYGLNEPDKSDDPDLMNLEMNEDLLSLFDMNDNDNSLFRMFDEEDDTDDNISEEEAKEEVEQLKQLIDEVKSAKGIDLLERMELGSSGDSSTSPIVGERLFTFDEQDRTYSLVRLLQPPILIGKEDSLRSGRYTLLSDAERSQIIPILETMIKEDYQNLLDQTTKSSQQAP